LTNVKGILTWPPKLVVYFKEMKKTRILYWVTTALISATMLYTAVSYFTDAKMKASFLHLGFPDFFRIELGIAKGIGAIVLLLPIATNRLKEAAYVGFGITFVSAIVAHLSHGDPIALSLQALVLLWILATSYYYFKKVVSFHG
jgi:hypothetical protein